MKNCLCILFLLAATSVHADVIAQWDFNSAPPDGSGSTGSTNASTGSGVLDTVGGVSRSFAAGHTSDPAATDNTAINLGAFPPATKENKTAGIKVAVDTGGYQQINVSWSQRCSASASRYYRFQYSLDGLEFIDATNVISLVYPNANTASLKFTNFSVDLRAIAGVADNPNFAFQIVSEFESTAAQTGMETYVPTVATNNYTASGTARFEMLTVSGVAAGVPNSRPTISPITNITMRAGGAYPPIAFTIDDAETPASELSLFTYSSNPILLPEAGIVIAGSGANRAITLTPALNESGMGVVSITVVDGAGKSNSTIFALTVIPAKTSPAIGAILNCGTIVNTPTAPIPFVIGDLDTPASDLVVSAASGNAAVLPQSGVVLAGSASNRTITLTPAPGKVGHVPVTITVSDGELATNRVFLLSIDPSAGTVFHDFFSYPNGSLVTNSAFLWQNRSGNTGQLSVVDGMVYVTSENDEDVYVRLRGEPFSPTNHSVLYYSLIVSAYNLPTALGDYFAHLKDNGSTFRAKLFVAATNAESGYYRIGVANGASLSSAPGYSEVPTDITIDETNLVVVRYQVAAGVTTLWLNPASEASASVSATDLIGSTNSITQFAIRESRFQGDLYVDNIRVATSFAEALGSIADDARVRVAHVNGNIRLAWPAAGGYVLETCTELGADTWEPAPQTPTLVGTDHVVTIENLTGTAFYRLTK